MKKILILGSGALKIGEAGEFDYSGSQAIKAFKEYGHTTILINPNIATIQTSEKFADKVYFLPITPYFVEQVIKKEKPDGIVLSFGGQTALNCGIELHKKHVLKKYNISILGTSIQSIILSEDREKFASHLNKIGQSVAPSKTATTIKEALQVGQEIGYPVMVRAAFTLGGQKSGIARNDEELRKRAQDALVFAPQVLVEKYLYHFKEVEYEIVRDKSDNCIAVCNMENFDPMGIHTGESIVVAPSQTLSNVEYHKLRTAAITIARSLDIVGECNVQFALNPHPRGDVVEYYVIELNARLSRSSALASKAVGYPLAYLAAQLILGKNLNEVKNQVTQVTQSCFEPALDYIVVKIPRWDLEKFKGAEEKIGSSMKSVGEVMGIGRTFEEALQKAIRMLDSGADGITDSRYNSITLKDALHCIQHPTPKRIFALPEAIRQDVPIERIHTLSGIDPWFLHGIQTIVEAEERLKKIKEINKVNLLELKRLGFSDSVIGKRVGQKELQIRDIRKKWGIIPSIFQIDTLAGEVPAQTNYLYMTYGGSHNDVKPLGKEGVLVLGSGPYHIGSSVEFDWTCVTTAQNIKKQGKKSIIINCNPETVSTDYDISDRLYFEELTFERVTDIYDFEKSLGIVLSVGGQAPNSISQKIFAYNVPVLGTSPVDINKAENRNIFSHILDTLKIKQPAWNSFTNFTSLLSFVKKVGYPVLIRPSYVLSGSAMALCHNEKELKQFVTKASLLNKDYPITVSQFISEAKEIEFDGVAQKGELMVYAISEHIEHAGVHSGDATVMYPAQQVYLQTEKAMHKIATQLIKSLNVTGPFNIQFLAKENDVYVIEMNIRASRTFPFISKASGINFAELLAESLFGCAQKKELSQPDYVVVKAPQFSFARLEGVDPVLRVEMASTGEVACFGDTAEEAYLKAIYSTGVSIREKTALISIGGDANKERLLNSIWRLNNMGFTLFATQNTHLYLKKKGIPSTVLQKVYENKSDNVVDVIEQKKVSLVINISEKYEEAPMVYEKLVSDGYLIRRAAIDNNIPLFTDMRTTRYFIRAIEKYSLKDLQIKSWNEYVI
ncbi:MAG: carbamoyl-phosphate synthase (glutamine-hydrolyzing) large subunit [Microgenomates group bacterium]